MPSTGVGAGGRACSAARAATARCAVGQDSPWLAAASLTHRLSATASATARRSRPVVRTPAGTSSIDSVNDFRGQAGSRHRHLLLRQRTRSRARPYGRSFGR